MKTPENLTLAQLAATCARIRPFNPGAGHVGLSALGRARRELGDRTHYLDVEWCTFFGTSSDAFDVVAGGAALVLLESQSIGPDEPERAHRAVVFLADGTRAHDYDALGIPAGIGAASPDGGPRGSSRHTGKGAAGMAALDYAKICAHLNTQAGTAALLAMLTQRTHARGCARAASCACVRCRTGGAA